MKIVEVFEHGGRKFDVREESNGTFTLLLWTSPGSSFPMGPFANAETARYCAEHLPAADFDPKAVKKVDGFRATFAESVVNKDA